ncbi:hypothetical protein phytr_12710 [Candidatus Phycorickettsia trachydisci]|uniref:Uncharacterized protein n=1 Tax=Candidatus Phycorickettsia trachydisci TaxID=2115978 RepID=A0A2P1PAC1_9RICK|nr:hypothetical protein [Candidatus Phycorickettsia trachydisci]AVP88195.1 hypothetical protein phytr_12710 [Candidatus Phycorickettsia trachydisci]
MIEDFSANVDQNTIGFYTPAQLAPENGNIPCLIELIKHNADLSLSNLCGKDVMYFLSESNSELKDIINHPEAHLEVKDGHLQVIGGEYYIEVS